MYDYINGIVAGKGHNELVVEAGGVGYSLYCSLNTMQDALPVGEMMRVCSAGIEEENRIQEDLLHKMEFESGARNIMTCSFRIARQNGQRGGNSRSGFRADGSGGRVLIRFRKKQTAQSDSRQSGFCPFCGGTDHRGRGHQRPFRFWCVNP